MAVTTEPCEEDELSVGGTKFGGLPSLPAGMDWPRSTLNWPLEFLAQFDLAELRRTVVGRALPPDGLLSFFMFHDYARDWYGDDARRGTPGGLRIIHTPAGADLRGLEPPDDLDAVRGRPNKTCRVRLTDALDIPDFERGRAVGRPEVLNDADHQLLGYSHVTVLAEDPTPGPEWEQLLRFGSEDKLGWGWGDGHRLFWYIRSADLRAGSFDGTVAIDG